MSAARASNQIEMLAVQVVVFALENKRDQSGRHTPKYTIDLLSTRHTT